MVFIEVQYIFCHLCGWKIKHIFSKLVYWALFKITRHDNKIAYAGSLRNTLSYANGVSYEAHFVELGLSSLDRRVQEGA